MDTHAPNYEVFNAELQTFVTKLCAAYPQHAPFAELYQKCCIAAEANIAMPLREFRAATRDFGDHIMNRDDAFFLEIAPRHKFLHGLGIGAIWPSATQHTKDCIWQYIMKLYCIATGNPGGGGAVASTNEGGATSQHPMMDMISAMPPGIMDSVCNVAAGLTAQLNEESVSKVFDPNADPEEKQKAQAAFFDVIGNTLRNMTAGADGGSNPMAAMAQMFGGGNV